MHVLNCKHICSCCQICIAFSSFHLPHLLVHFNVASLSVYDGSAGSTSGGTVPNQCSSQYAACMCLLLQLDMVICGRGSAVVFQQGIDMFR